MEWRLSRFDEAFVPPMLSFSTCETKLEALETARDHPHESLTAKNRINGPKEEVISHEGIADWCKKHPRVVLKIKQQGTMRPAAAAEMPRFS